MRRRSLIEILLVGTAAALLPRFLMTPPSTADKPPLPFPTPAKPPITGWTVRGVQPTMVRAEVEALLGKPDFSGPLPVKAERVGTYVEYGNRNGTWNGRPTIVYDPEGRIISIVGDVAERDGVVVFRLGADQREVSELFPHALVDNVHLKARTPEGDLNLTFESGHLVRMLFTAI